MESEKNKLGFKREREDRIGRKEKEGNRAEATCSSPSGEQRR